MLQEYIRYLKDNPKGYWFKRKLYGWGWTPATWQGWLSISVYLGAIILIAIEAKQRTSSEEIPYTHIMIMIVITVALVYLCYVKGEKPRWQWGLPNKTK